MKKGTSSVWQGIVSARQIIKKGACFSIGNGCNINLWTYPWIPNLLEVVLKIKEGISCENVIWVFDLKDFENNDWNF